MGCWERRGRFRDTFSYNLHVQRFCPNTQRNSPILPAMKMCHQESVQKTWTFGSMQMYEKQLIQLNFHYFKDSKLTPNPETFPDNNYLSLFCKGNEGQKKCVGMSSFTLCNYCKYFPARSFGVRLSHALLLSLPTMGRNRIFRVAKTDLPIVISEALWIKKKKRLFYQ